MDTRRALGGYRSGPRAERQTHAEIVRRIAGNRRTTRRQTYRPYDYAHRKYRPRTSHLRIVKHRPRFATEARRHRARINLKIRIRDSTKIDGVNLSSLSPLCENGFPVFVLRDCAHQGIIFYAANAHVKKVVGRAAAR